MSVDYVRSKAKGTANTFCSADRRLDGLFQESDADNEQKHCDGGTKSLIESEFDGGVLDAVEP